MVSAILGIDISKAKADVALLVEGKCKHKTIKNKPEGFETLIAWLRRQKIDRVHACMEATGPYGEDLAKYLYDEGHEVSVVNPVRIKGFAQSELLRNKTDKIDAALIARFCLKMKPDIWVPPPPEVSELKSLVRRLESLIQMKVQETNRLDGTTPSVEISLRRHIEYLEKEIEETRRLIRDHIDRHPGLKENKDLLSTIPGIGETTVAMILAEIGSVHQFKSAKKLAAFIGLTPQRRESGSSVRGRTSLAKAGNARLRKALYMPAIVAKKHNPVIARFCLRLQEAGKPPMVTIGASMRKLVHIIYGVLKSRKPFDVSLHY